MGFFNNTGSNYGQSGNNKNWMNTTSQKIVSNTIASKTIAGVYGWMMLGVLMSAATGVYLVQSPLMKDIVNSPLYFLFFILQIGLVFTMSFAANKMSVGTLKLLFAVYSLLTGVTFAVILSSFNIGQVIYLFIVAALGFAILALFGAVTKKNLGFLGTFLMMGFFMVLGASLLNIFFHSPLLNNFIGWLGILVFSGLTAYDSQRIRSSAYELAESSNGDVQTMGRFMVLGALTMYLNFINLFISLLRVFGGSRN